MPVKSPATRSATIGASAATAAAATLIPQTSQAALVTVGPVGGVDSVVLSLGQGTDFGGLLTGSSIFYASFAGETFVLSGGGYLPGGFAYRSTGSFTPTSSAINTFWTFFSANTAANGAELSSNDNWIGGTFLINGVNGTNPVWAWLHVGLGDSPGSFEPNIISLTYDDTATDATPFAKPVGGFVVPEPSSVSLLALGAGGVLAHRRRTKGQISK
ncbi:MAG: PEP-CTERM sorting domain-containing protein [Verrucomicrobiota bacterium]